MIKYLITLSLTLLPFMSISQELKTTSTLADFNDDNKIDSLCIQRTYSKNSYEQRISITDGDTGETFMLKYEHLYSQLKVRTGIPKALLKPKNKPFFDTIKQYFYPIKKIDASLDWILKAEKSLQKIADNKYYNLAINPKTPWINGNYTEPASYSIEEIDSLSTSYLLTYYGSNYSEIEGRPIKKITQNKKYKVFATQHGVFVKKGNRYKWLFVSDDSTTNVPEKARWKSIGKIVLVGKYLILQQILAPAQYAPVYIIDVEKGYCGRINASEYDDKISYEIEKKKLTLTIADDTISFSLKKLFKELKKINFKI